jgi:hypothetical protein
MTLNEPYERQDTVYRQTVILPCLEFFVRAYARNMEICRALACKHLKATDSGSVI